MSKNSDFSNNSKADDFLQLVTFKIGNEKFGIDILKVKEIIRMVDITKVPKSPYFVDGVINLRGKVIPIINIRVRFEMKRVKSDSNTRIIVFELGSKIIGFIVDEVNEVLRIPNSSIEKPPELITDIDTKYISSLAIWNNQMIILLDLNKILTISEQ